MSSKDVTEPEVLRCKHCEYFNNECPYEQGCVDSYNQYANTASPPLEPATYAESYACSLGRDLIDSKRRNSNFNQTMNNMIKIINESHNYKITSNY